MSLGLGYHSSLAAILGNLQDVTSRITEHTSPKLQGTRDKLRELTDEWRVNLEEHVATSKQYTHLLKPKKKWQLFLISAVICGIELAYSAETAFVSPILLKIGIPTSLMSLIWCLSPLLGLVLVPIMGSLSDNCHSRFGRRRPFIFVLSFGIIVGLILVPNGRYLGAWVAGIPAPFSPSKYEADHVFVAANNISISSSNLRNREKSGTSITDTLSSNSQMDVASLPNGTTSISRNKTKEDDYYYYYYYEESRENGTSSTASTSNSPQQNSDTKFRSKRSANKKHNTEDLVETIEFTIPHEAAANRKYRKAKYLSILFTCLGVVVLDFCADASQSPSRAMMLDLCLPEQHTSGLSTFTILAGFGGSLGYMLGAIDWERSFQDVESKIITSLLLSSNQTTEQGNRLSGSIVRKKDHYRIVFGIILVLFVICLVITLNSFKELPLNYDVNDKPVDYGRRFTVSWFKEIFQSPTPHKTVEYPRTKVMYNPVIEESHGSFDENEGNSLELSVKRPSPARHSIKKTLSEDEKSIKGLKMPGEYIYTGPKKESLDYFGHISASSRNTEGYDSSESGHSRKEGDSWRSKGGKLKSIVKSTPEVLKKKKLKAPVSLKSYLRSIIRMPKFLRLLCVTNLFSWMSLVCYSLYFTDYVGQSIFRGDPKSPENSFIHGRYEEGVRYGCWGMSLYSATCSVYSYMIESLVKKFGAKKVYVYGQLAYSVGILVMGLAKNKMCVILLSTSPGIMYATLFTMPYILITHFHQQNYIERESSEEGANIIMDHNEQIEQLRGLGTDIAIVSSMVFWAQCILSSVIGSIMDRLNTTAIVPFTASFLSFLGAVCAWKINYPPGI